MKKTCRICSNAQKNAVYTAREMMFGYRDEFEYFQCSACGCLQISEVPADLARYYPDNYYSFCDAAEPPAGRLKRFLKRQRTCYYLRGKGVLGRILVLVFSEPGLPDWVRSTGLDPDARVLELGCGSAGLLVSLRNEGFSNLTGVDPYIKEDVVPARQIRVYKKEVAELDGEFDFIMLHHSFEHLADPLEALQTLGRRLSPDGQILIRIPIVPSFAWRTYGANWVQLDAPRHLYLHSLQSVAYLAGKTGLTVEHIEYDSNAFQFWGSEQYVRDIPLCDARSYSRKSPTDSLFTEKDVQEFRARADALNRAGEGDQVCLVLRKNRFWKRGPSLPLQDASPPSPSLIVLSGGGKNERQTGAI